MMNILIRLHKGKDSSQTNKLEENKNVQKFDVSGRENDKPFVDDSYSQSMMCSHPRWFQKWQNSRLGVGTGKAQLIRDEDNLIRQVQCLESHS